ncbi:MAG: hypothetical protein MK138_01455, partial [Planctomycetes bacterium]|nr:hypothetical protein [Planctomycetota bacterium]
KWATWTWAAWAGMLALSVPRPRGRAVAGRAGRDGGGARRRGILFYLSLGELESNALAASNRHLRDVLRAGGYKLKWSRFAGNHNSRTWCAALAAGLEVLLPGS